MEFIRPVFEHHKELGCMAIVYPNARFLVDNEYLPKIMNSVKQFHFQKEGDLYPSYKYNYRFVNYLECLFGNGEIENYAFNNKDICDLRKSNVVAVHSYSKYVKENYDVIEYLSGHYPTRKHHSIMKNPKWRINENGKEKILMYCEVDTICILCPESHQKILDFEKNECGGKKLTFTKMTNGYISTHISANKALFIHQIITGHYGQGRGTKNLSIDHIDRNPLNNTMENLRIATREEQEQNSKGIAPDTKRARQSNARPLPEGITQDMLRKYVVFYSRLHNKETGVRREYFVVERHPLLDDKRWESSKSAKLTMLEKLEQANKVVEDLDKGILPEKLRV